MRDIQELMPQVTAFQPLQIDADTASWVAGNADRRWAAFLNYWQTLAEKLGHLPARRDLDPVEISGSLLPSIFLIDILPADQHVARTRFRFRLLGSEIIARETVRRDTYLDQLGSITDLAAIERQYHDAMAMRIWMRAATLLWEAALKDHITYKVIVLPLADDDGAIGHLIGCAVYDDERRNP